MVNSSILKWAGLLGVLACLVAVTNCHDFEQALEDCKANDTCFPDEDNDGVDDRKQDAGPDGGTDGGPTGTDAGRDGGTTPDSGTPDSGTPDSGTPDSGTPDSGTPDSGTPDSGPVATDAGTALYPGDLDLGTCDPASGLCLKHEYPVGGSYELSGLWGSSATEVFLVARAQTLASAQFVRFSNGTFTSSLVPDMEFQPLRIHGSSASNVWTINETSPVRACSAALSALPDGGTEVDAGTLTCPSPVYRFEGGSWAQVPYGDGTVQLLPSAIFAAEPAQAWAVTGSGDVVKWANGTWTPEAASLGVGAAPKAFWGDGSGPRFAVGTDSSLMAAYWQRTGSTWGITSNLTYGPFIAIAGPNVNHLYAATLSEVFRWNPTNPGWELETSASGQVQDLWVSGDGSEVWVTLKTASVLRKRSSAWATIALPVAPDFSALQVEGFDTTAGDLWITGTHSSARFVGSIAYHFERQ